MLLALLSMAGSTLADDGPSRRFFRKAGQHPLRGGSQPYGVRQATYNQLQLPGAFQEELPLPETPAEPTQDELPPPTQDEARGHAPALFPVMQPEQARPAEAQPLPGARPQPPAAEPPMRVPPPLAADRRCLTADDVKAIGKIDLDIRLQPGDVPKECRLVDDVYEPRCWPCVTYTWKASALCHKPLYFEEVGLERYGHSAGCFVQPVISGAHFFGSLALLPYKMGVEHPCDCRYPLGYYRPGNCAPKLIYTLPLSARGAAYQAGAVTGLVFFVP